jgi:hypothetical protein
MVNDTATSDKVAAAVTKTLQDAEFKCAELRFGEVRVVLSKGRRLESASSEPVRPAEYPDVPTSLKDDQDSWLK